MQKIVPFLWFDTQAEAAVNFYTSLFDHSKTGDKTYYETASSKVSGKPVGSVMTVAFQLAGQDFIAINGGPEFTFTPATSFFVSCESVEEVDRLWQKLSEGGTALMELGEYPFSEKFGWVQDKFGLSWQLILAKRTPKITPFFLLTGSQNGKAEAAIQLYTSMFENSSLVSMDRFGVEEGNTEGHVKNATFLLEGQAFIIMESELGHPFTFTPAVSFMVNCKTQAEIDKLWNGLSQGGDVNAQQCGWLADQFGVSWQIVPETLNALLRDTDQEKGLRVMHAMLQMKKLDIEKLQAAHDGKAYVSNP